MYQKSLKFHALGADVSLKSGSGFSQFTNYHLLVIVTNIWQKLSSVEREVTLIVTNFWQLLSQIFGETTLALSKSATFTARPEYYRSAVVMRFERAVFLLREVFEYDFAEIATMLGKSEAACRRSFSRAKKHLSEHRPRFPPSSQIHRRMLTGFFQAAQGGDMTPLMDLLSEEVTLWADGGGKIKTAALRPIVGRDAVARFSLGAVRFLPADYQVEIAEVNGQAAVIIRAGGQALFVLSIEVEAGQIQALRIIANPEKLARI
jgi:Sigma-70, region 4